MKYAKAFLIWLLMLPMGIINGAVRVIVTEPLLGSAIALPLSGIIFSVLLFFTAFLLIPKIGKCSMTEYIIIGAAWFILTNAAEVAITVIEGNPASGVLMQFDVTTGNLWLLVVTVCLVSPAVAAKVRGLV